MRHIRLFLAIADEGSMSGAARRLGVSQPSVSKALADLESMLGAKLVERVGRGIGLTPDGTVFCRTASDAVRQLDSCAAELGPGRLAQTLRVGCLPTVAGGFFPDVALDRSSRQKGLRITVLTGSHRNLLAMLRAGEIDLVVGRMPDSDDIAGLAFEWLYDEEIVLVARADHPYAKRGSNEALRQCRLILPPANAIIRRPVQDFLVAQGIMEPDIAFETVSLAAGRRLLETSDMVWFISHGVVARELDDGSLTLLALNTTSLRGAVGLTRKRGQVSTDEERALIEALHVAARNRPGVAVYRLASAPNA